MHCGAKIEPAHSHWSTKKFKVQTTDELRGCPSSSLVTGNESEGTCNILSCKKQGKQEKKGNFSMGTLVPVTTV